MRGGVGIVFSDRACKGVFKEAQFHQIEDIKPGRIMAVRVDFQSGNKAWFVNVHMDHESHRNRVADFDLLKKFMVQQQAHLLPCFILGDFNYVEHMSDRVSVSMSHNPAVFEANLNAEVQGAREHKRSFWGPYAFHEIMQDVSTHVDTFSAARLDRIYSNHHPADQLAFEYFAFRHKRSLSDHAAVTAGKRLMKAGG